MRRKHVLSLLMLSTGVALLVAATTVGVASARTDRAHAKNALKGGTLQVVQSAGAFDTLDPGLAYVTNDWAVLSTTQLLLVNFPNKPGQAGSQLFPEAATSFPKVSKGGKVYTFKIRKGLKFNNGKPVTAANYRRAWERILSPKMYAQYGTFLGLDQAVKGAAAFTAGKAKHISGISASGRKLVFHLTRANPTFTAILGMQWFGAVPANLKYTKSSGGVLKYPSAGPYYIASNTPGRLTVLKRNKHYHGPRFQNPSQIVIHSFPNSNGEAALLQIEKGQVDFDMAGVPSDDVANVVKKYGVNKGQFHTGTQSCIIWEAFNNARPPTNNVKVRTALNYAIGRLPIIKLLGPLAGSAADQALVPGIAGYQKLHLYGNYPDFKKAKAVGGSALNGNPPLNIYYNAASAVRTNEAQFEKAQLAQIGLNGVLQPSDPSSYYGPLETKGTSYNIAHSGWCADYFDPFDFINVNFDGRTIAATGNVNYFYFYGGKAFYKQLDAAASKLGKARASAYAALDKALMTKYVPMFPLYIPNSRFLVSHRVKNWIYSNYFGYPDLNAMSVG